MKEVLKLTRRCIRSSKGRFFALMMIVCVSVAFFAGLNITRDAMADTADCYLEKTRFGDFKAISTLGWTKDDLKKISHIEGVETCQGFKTQDALVFNEKKMQAFHFISLPKKNNRPKLKSGRLPEKSGECLADSKLFSSKDIGREIVLSGKNNKETTDKFKVKKWKITGICDSPEYMSQERGSSKLGGGTAAGFFYLKEGDFKDKIYMSAVLRLKDRAPAYSDEYEELIKSLKPDIKAEIKDIANDRYRELNRLRQDRIEKAKKAALISAMSGRKAALSKGSVKRINIDKIPEIPKPEVYLLTRCENRGYESFKSDTSIVNGISAVFPLFFLMIAVLVCVTTITRLVDEERTQIGTLKAIGYSDASIAAKYILYAQAASVTGWFLGFFPGTYFLPKIFWKAYSVVYDFAPIRYVMSEKLAVVTFVVTTAVIMGSAWLSCRRELGNRPAPLLRPKPPKSGKRVFLERIPSLWERFSFLQKVTIRNMLRYRRRFIMMVVGIGCCSALVLTAFGVKDSMTNVIPLQFDKIQTHDILVSVEPGSMDRVQKKIEDSKSVGKKLSVYTDTVDAKIKQDDGKHRVHKNMRIFVVPENIKKYREFFGFFDSLNRGINPEKAGGLFDKNTSINGIMVGGPSMELFNVKEGGYLELKEDQKFKVSGKIKKKMIWYVDNIIFVPKKLIKYEDKFREKDLKDNGILIKDVDNPEQFAKVMVKTKGVEAVSRIDTVKTQVEDGLESLDYMIGIIIGFSALLAFIVIYNLTNINLAERYREVATVMVLGFLPEETEKYILRENIVISVAAGLFGLVPGIFLHHFVMKKIVTDTVMYPIYINPLSYLFSFMITVGFAIVVNLAMKKRIAAIDMAESLKAVE